MLLLLLFPPLSFLAIFFLGVELDLFSDFNIWAKQDGSYLSRLLFCVAVHVLMRNDSPLRHVLEAVLERKKKVDIFVLEEPGASSTNSNNAVWKKVSVSIFKERCSFPRVATQQLGLAVRLRAMLLMAVSKLNRDFQEIDKYFGLPE